jgi:flagellar hook-associated protein 2
MGRIQSTVGLITGLPIQDTVDKLMAVQARPRDALMARQKVLGAEQAAVTDLMALVLGVQFATRRLANSEVIGQKKVTVSNPSVLAASASSSAVPGSYTVVPGRLAQSQRIVSGGLAAKDEALGGGTLTLGLGGWADTALPLTELNGGSGFARGKLRITDRSGASAVIDLRFAQTVDDVLAAINRAEGIAVRAVADGNRFILYDESGGSGNLRVQEVAGGTTAASLGLAGINVAANQASGQSVLHLASPMLLASLRDGAGLSVRSGLAELHLVFRDGSSLDVDLNPTGQAAPKTVGQLLDRLNAAAPTRLAARLSSDGLRVELEDLTSGAGSFQVSSPTGGTLAEELGLAGTHVSGIATGSRLVPGLKTTLLSSLRGGTGLGPLGTIQITDRTGASATVDLSGAETLDDVLAAINSAGLSVRASYNAARNGIVVVDTSQSTASNLVITDGDATQTATKLGLAGNVAADTLQSGDLARQTVSRNTLLSTYRFGQPVSLGSFLITDSLGRQRAVNLKLLGAQTVGDVIDAINSLGLAVEARLNATGDGIALIDTGQGSGTLTVADVSGGHTAADLRLAGQGQPQIVDGQPAQVIDGSTTLRIELQAQDTLDDLVAKLRASGGPVQADVLRTGDGPLPYRLALTSTLPGLRGALRVDGSALGLSFTEITPAQDAALQVGADGPGSTLLTSIDNRFQAALPGVDVTLSAASPEPVTITVAQNADSLANALQTLVDSINKVRDKLATYTAFDPSTNTKGTLFGSAETLRIDTTLATLATGSFRASGAVRSLAELGVTLGENGKLSLDKSRFQARYDADPASVIDFFADKQRGFAKQADELLERLVGKNQSMLVGRVQTLQRQIDFTQTRIDQWNARLDRQREQLLNQFYRLEEVVGRIRNNLNAISQIQFIPPIFRGNGNA